MRGSKMSKIQTTQSLKMSCFFLHFGLATLTWQHNDQHQMSPLSKCLVQGTRWQTSFCNARKQQDPYRSQGQRTGRKAGGEQANSLENKGSVLGAWESEAWGGASPLQQRCLGLGRETTSALCFLVLSCVGCLPFQESSFWKASLLSSPCQRDKRKHWEENRKKKSPYLFGINNRID